MDSSATSASSLAAFRCFSSRRDSSSPVSSSSSAPALTAGRGRCSPLLAGAASAYELASAMTGATTNLNLSYFILLAVLCLISIPRAFSAGKMGWSRSAAPRYG